MKKKYNEKQSKKIRNLVALCLLCGVIFATATYAWFIGMRTVNVSQFDINIASTEGLYLSMDGVSWTYELDVANAPAYDNNANQIKGVELIPMSTIGEMDKTSSRMKLYQKGSLTATAGGYRLLASQVDNHTDTNDDSGEYLEGKGYIAFDLFIKNMSGDAYYAENDPLNEEAIYLTTNSSVTLGVGGEQNTGIENSVRVAFAQIGRVIGSNTDQATITGIDCTGDADPYDDDPNYVTGICRKAQIWEPNNTDHVTNAINWYNEACSTRKADEDGKDITKDSAYNVGTACGTVANGTENHTYAIAKEIKVGDPFVDVYDGATLNTYTTSTTNGQLVDFDAFTDKEKDLTGVDRPTFMTLAPNSITKVRVYVWIEGQDVDNYDFAQLGKQITVNFGFTKERFTEDDVNYDGPSTDVTPHVVEYQNEGTVDTISNSSVYFVDALDQFIIPVDVTDNFTFNDGAAQKTATYDAGQKTWSIA